jgi:putative peptidoglycan lipid II flippase
LSERSRRAETPSRRPKPRRGLAGNTAIFSIATGLSRIAGLVREIVASAFFGTRGSFSAFTLAFQIPNLFANLFAQAALSAAFVPVFTELLEKGRKREAFKLASTLFWIILIALGGITAFFVLVAGVVMPLFTGSLGSHDSHLAVGLSRVLFPIVLLLGLNGLLVGILQTYDSFSIPAISPLVWNAVIILSLLVLRPQFHGDGQLYAYAIGILIGTVAQFAMAGPALKRIDFRLGFQMDWRDPLVRDVFVLMLPVTFALGIINLDQIINSTLGTLITNDRGGAPRAIDAAFRIYMLPQGMFSVAVTTVLFPTMGRLAARRDVAGLRRVVGTGMRQINLLLIPAAAFLLVLSTPVVRLIYQHGKFGPYSTHLVSVALFWFAVSLPFNGLNLLLTRTFFAVKRPWIPTKLAGVNMVVDIIISVALYKPFGIGGLVVGTAVANAVMTWLQLRRLKVGFNGRLEGQETVMITARVIVASVLLAVASGLVWLLVDAILGRSLVAQIVSLGAAGAAGIWIYLRAVLAMRIPEAEQVRRMIASRMQPAP